MEFFTIIGIAASVCTAVASVPQFIKIIKEKEADSISIGMMATLIAGLCLWVYYGIMKGDAIIIISNSFSVIINVLLLAFSLYYKKKPVAAN